MVLYDAALLVESGRADDFRPLIVVTASPQTQLGRILHRDGLNRDAARARLKRKCPSQIKLPLPTMSYPMMEAGMSYKSKSTSYGEHSLNHDHPMRPVALITGFPRLLARALATEGIQKWNASKVFVLHEEVDQEQANRFIASLPETIQERVVPLVGQLAGVDLRLSGAELMEVQSTVTHVFHAANDVSTPERRLHGTVGALNQLLRLAREMPHLQSSSQPPSSWQSNRHCPRRGT